MEVSQVSLGPCQSSPGRTESSAANRDMVSSSAGAANDERTGEVLKSVTVTSLRLDAF